MSAHLARHKSRAPAAAHWARNLAPARSSRFRHPAEWFDLYANLALVHGYAADVTHAEGYVRARNGSGLGGRGERTARTLPAQRE